MAENLFGAAILAAGASTRMGRPKLLLPWAGTTVIGRLIAQWRTAGAVEIAVVCAEGDASLGAELDRLKVPAASRIVNGNAARGMFSSIQCAAAHSFWPASMQHLAIVLGDQPHLRTATLAALAQFAAKHPGAICQPSYAGRKRHPVFIPAELLPALAVSATTSLREFLAEYSERTVLMASDDDGLEVDLDTPADYELALGRFGDRD